MARKRNETVEDAVPTPGPEAALPAESTAEEVPTYTLRADRRFDVLGVIMLARLAREGGAREKAAELDALVREFELWEEAHA